ncbi:MULTISPECIES: LacI family transcriptional regulator [unclassified Phyllobacterium]|uniref:LacI family transcriptional regulator n=1 Tax=Phyllobacterium TaxID=28100 RepID=UPI0015F921DD|nr:MULTISPECIES: LacI family transcriptional regulator [unclassified Phyllobacterium]MBA8901747.1 LacI family transcriptional regulator [Phyllobacterium sp. P30BS-XVII]UGX88573.1 LacI family transcriptional regulator [Phyllobacterium sp. T1293]
MNDKRHIPLDGEKAATLSEGERPTLKTIAFMAGLGVTTVSRALKDAPEIGQATKNRVQLIARQIGYRPNRAGVRLRTGKTNVISLVLNAQSEIMGLTSNLVYGISEILAETPYHLIVTPYSPENDPMQPIRYIFETGSADGIIMSQTEPSDPRVRYLTDHNFPFATHGRTRMGIEHPFHDFDNEAYAYAAVKSLAERGRRRIAMVAGPSPAHTYYWHLDDGFRRGLQESGATAVPLDHWNGTLSLTDVRNLTEIFMREPNPPDGIICCTGGLAVAVVAGIEATGLKLGRDVDLVSKQTTNFLQWFRPEVIVYNEDIRHAGRELARAVLRRIEGVDPTQLQSLSYPEADQGERIGISSR